MEASRSSNSRFGGLRFHILCAPAWVARGNVQIWGSVGQGDGQSARSKYTGAPSRSRSSWLAQGPVTANLALAWSTDVTVLLHLDAGAGLHGVAQHRSGVVADPDAVFVRVAGGWAGGHPHPTAAMRGVPVRSATDSV